MNSDTPSTSNAQTYRFLEVLCVFFWFLLDGFWLLEWKLLTYICSAIAIAIAAVMFRYMKKEPVVLLVAGADTCWLLFNVLWAVDDLSQIPHTLLAAKILFIAGGVFCFGAYCVSDAHKRFHILVLSRLRTLKYFQGRSA